MGRQKSRRASSFVWKSMDPHLVGGAITILKNMKVNGKDDIPYMKWTIKHVPNHQPDHHHIPIVVGL